MRLAPWLLVVVSSASCAGAVERTPAVDGEDRFEDLTRGRVCGTEQAAARQWLAHRSVRLAEVDRAAGPAWLRPPP